jgi:non-ribosomal peptide synthetase component F
MSIPDALYQRASSTPDRFDLVDDTDSLTYAQLRGMAARLARSQASAGVGPGDRVASGRRTASTGCPPASGSTWLAPPSSVSDIIFTSGTTGTPKRCRTDGASVRTYQAWSDLVCVRTDDRYLVV